MYGIACVCVYCVYVLSRTRACTLHERTDESIDVLNWARFKAGHGAVTYIVFCGRDMVVLKGREQGI